jgi:hypothetical protein
VNCPTCSHTMQQIAEYLWNCPRCGTCRTASGIVTVPKLVGRCRHFENSLLPGTAMADVWRILGIEESINLPDNRRPSP